ncbi:serine hydrolase domain-containing protein [Nonomuraea ceibae]|uniref:serine hydrolase domain-containing protein n=1 Tax=Nonomuraea ceibae TaxID=1935170 RepID=UPI001C5E19F2|nr:serine hydrolase domain-containing protein [Nonomuraea ceibae]
MSRSRSGALTLLALALAACSPASHEPLGDFLARTLPAGPGGPGGTVLTAHGDHITYCQGFGLADRATRTAATCDTAYDIMSITKQFTAAAILKLEVLGELRVTDPISAHLGRAVPAGKRGITVQHLLTHTSGLPESLGDDYAPLTRDDLLARAMSAPLRTPPGAEFHYSNTGYSVLAAVIETVSGLSYERFLAKHLFAPAGMTSTGYVLPRWKPGQVAVEYDATGRSMGRPHEHPWGANGPYWNLHGNGGMLSTARDLFRWHRALMGDAVLPASAKTKLFTAYVPTGNDGESYGYGWNILRTDGGRIAWHNGGNSWSLAAYARSLDAGTMAFWAGNQVRREGRWNLEDLEPGLTLGILTRAAPDTDSAPETPPAPWPA